jgi:hypothetical protein
VSSTTTTSSGETPTPITNNNPFLQGPMSPEQTEQFAGRLQQFVDDNLVPFVNAFKTFCTDQSTR